MSHWQHTTQVTNTDSASDAARMIQAQYGTPQISGSNEPAGKYQGLIAANTTTKTIQTSGLFTGSFDLRFTLLLLLRRRHGALVPAARHAGAA